MTFELITKPPKQVAWHINIHEKMSKSKRIIDSMSQGEIYEMYKNREFICDDCGEKISNTHLLPIDEHIIHLIDPSDYWVCEGCTQKDFHNKNVIASDL